MPCSFFRLCLLLAVSASNTAAAPDTTRFTNRQDCNCRSDGSVFCAAGNCRCLRDNDETCASVCTPDGGSSFSCSSGNDCCDTGRRQRKLQGADFVVDLENDVVHQQLYEDVLERCGNVEYQGYLFVTSHLFAVAVPPSDDGECPFLVTHSYFDSERAQARKQLLYWETKQEGEARFANGSLYEKSMYIGSFPLFKLDQAHREVPLSTQSYSLLENNCANSILGLAHSLEVPITPHMTAFVGRRLAQESSRHFLDKIRSSLSVAKEGNGSGSIIRSLWQWIRQWFFGGESPNGEAPSSDMEMVQQLVDAQASKAMTDL